MAPSSDTTFSFGKHRGKTFGEVADSDPSYCQWAKKTDSPSGALKDFISFLDTRSSASPAGASPSSSSRAAAPGSAQDATRPAWLANTAPAANRAGFPGPKLDDDITLVMELWDDDKFVVRAEKNAGMADAGKGYGKSRSRPTRSAYVPPHIWHAIAKLRDCKVAADRDSNCFFFPRSLLEPVAQALELMGKVERVPSWVLRLHGAQSGQKGDCVIDERLPKDLLPYQREGVHFGLAHQGRCLFGDEMGLGKTLESISLAAQYAEEWPVLVLCPSTVRFVWKEQVAQWLPDFADPDDIQVIKKGSDELRPDALFWIISYYMMAIDSKKGEKSHFQQRPDGSPHGVVIADESHNIKEWGAERTRAAVPVLRKAKRAILLSGTPTRNSPDELHPQLCALSPNFNPKLSEFRSRYCMQSSHQLATGRTVSQVVGARNSNELNYLLTSTVMIRRLKKDVMSELPEKRRQKVPLEADAKQMKDVRKQMENVDPGASLVGESGREAISTLFLKTARAKLSAIKEYILEVLDRGDEKAIIFAHHQEVMEEISALLEKRLSKDGLYHMRIDGKTPGAKRPELVQKFQTDEHCRIALLSITACSEGLTLSAAGLVIFAELYWVPGAIEQAEARAHRIGNVHNKVVVEFLVVPGSPEERIWNSLERKKKDTSKLLNGAEESLGALQRAAVKRASELAEERGQRSLSVPSAKKPRMFASPAASQPAVPSVAAPPADASGTASVASAAVVAGASGAASVANAAAAVGTSISVSDGGASDAAAAPDAAPGAGSFLKRLKMQVQAAGGSAAGAIESPATRRSGEAKGTATDTPPPVSRSKVEYLLRASKG